MDLENWNLNNNNNNNNDFIRIKSYTSSNLALERDIQLTSHPF